MQLALDFRKVYVVKNMWGNYYHIQYEDGYTFEPLGLTDREVDPFSFSDEYLNHPDRQPAFFDSIEEAIKWAVKYGVTPILADGPLFHLRQADVLG